MPDDAAPSTRQQLTELIQDLRVVLPGAQVLFAFLLTLPFSGRFSTVITATDKTTYFVAFMTAAVASVLLIAPSILHRLYHRLDAPDGLASLLKLSNQLAILGTLFMAVSMAAVVFLITDDLYQDVAAGVVAAGIAALIAWLWFGLPFMRNWRRDEPSPR